MMNNNDYLKFYQQLTRPFHQHPWAIPLLRFVNKLVVWIMYPAYLVILLWAVRVVPLRSWLFLIVPGIGFMALSFIRQRIDAPRPYEKYAIEPLILRNKTGDSMPSRHVFSATVIAMCGLRLNLILGIILLALALISAVTRVIGGVHFPKDVIIGFLSGVFCGSLLFIV